MRSLGTLAVYPDERVTGEDDVTPRPARATDASNLSFPMPLMITIIGLAMAIAAAMWRIETRVSIITTSMEYERQLDVERGKVLEQRFNALEAKIDAAGLRNAAMAMAQSLQHEKEK